MPFIADSAPKFFTALSIKRALITPFTTCTELFRGSALLNNIAEVTRSMSRCLKLGKGPWRGVGKVRKSAFF